MSFNKKLLILPAAFGFTIFGLLAGFVISTSNPSVLGNPNLVQHEAEGPDTNIQVNPNNSEPNAPNIDNRHYSSIEVKPSTQAPSPNPTPTSTKSPCDS